MKHIQYEINNTGGDSILNGYSGSFKGFMRELVEEIELQNLRGPNRVIFEMEFRYCTATNKVSLN